MISLAASPENGGTHIPYSGSVTDPNPFQD